MASKRRTRGKLVFLVINTDTHSGCVLRADSAEDAADRALSVGWLRHATEIRVKPFCHKGPTLIFQIRQNTPAQGTDQ
jgi:hypothetical protein